MLITLYSASGSSINIPQSLINDSQTLTDLAQYIAPAQLSTLKIETGFSHYSIQCLSMGLKKMTVERAIVIYPIIDYLACTKNLIRLGNFILSMSVKIPEYVLARMADIPELGVRAVLLGFLSYTEVIRPKSMMTVSLNELEKYVNSITDPIMGIEAIRRLSLDPEVGITLIMEGCDELALRYVTRFMFKSGYDAGLMVALKTYPRLICSIYIMVARSSNIPIIDYVFSQRVNSEFEYISREEWFYYSLNNRSDYSLKLLQLNELDESKIDLKRLVISCRNNHSMLDHTEFIALNGRRSLISLTAIAMLMTGHCREAQFLIGRFTNVDSIKMVTSKVHMTMGLVGDDLINPDNTVQCLLLMRELRLLYDNYLHLILYSNCPRTWSIVAQLLRTESHDNLLTLLERYADHYLKFEAGDATVAWLIKLILTIIPRCDYVNSIINQFPVVICKSLDHQIPLLKPESIITITII